MKEKNDLNRAMKRLGEFGKLFVDYEGCPRGQKGRAFLPLEQEVLAMPPITDVDGGVWIPVNEDALRELVAEYIRLKKTAERDSDTAKKLVKMLEGCENVQLITAEASQEIRFGAEGPVAVLIFKD